MTDTIAGEFEALLETAYEDHQKGAAAPGDGLFSFMAKRLRAHLAAQPSAGAQGEVVCEETHVRRFLGTIPTSEMGQYADEIADALAKDRATERAKGGLQSLQPRIAKALKKGVNHLRGRSDRHTIADRDFMREVLEEVEACAATPAQPDTGDVAALREADATALFHAFLGSYRRGGDKPSRLKSFIAGYDAALSKPNAQGREG